MNLNQMSQRSTNLFRGRVGRATGISQSQLFSSSVLQAENDLEAAILALIVHWVLNSLPASFHAFSVGQTAIAMLALSSIAVLVFAHHRRRGTVLTQAQEEMILIGAFVLFLLSLMIAVRAYRTNLKTGRAGGIRPTRSSVSSHQGSQAPRDGRAREYPYPDACSRDARYCVIEEWY
ncbi:hypothetical protein SISSUDRAFT_619210 [Sistotremastrum suecicum HHB10207 ss-3]|uniref:Uncharacterized protein n=1 Tax=Sistotremastrum suecicum HHB10207 ss-3 TaxID=1314776 RepID=A0A166EHV8_9AGAM|nr:hypothetical protein SISSUDRAFT_619210 [Sistotremastrum suecicum HHB10207 ss-3]